MSTPRANNYREQAAIRCCHNCRHACGQYGRLFCGRASRTFDVDRLAVCDKYERAQAWR